MNLLDYLLAAIVAFCFIRGIFRGMIKEVSGIVGLFGGFYAAFTYYPLLKPYLSRWVADPKYLNILCFMAVLIGVYLAVALVAALLKVIMNVAFLGWADRLGGALLGAAKGALAAVILIMAMTAFLPRNAPLILESAAARRSMGVGSTVVRFTSGEMQQLLGTKMKELEKTWKKGKT